jgi:quercetin dioxygenase-like cupin family protein
MEAPDAKVVRIGDLELRFVIEESREMVAFEFVVPPNAKVPAPHYHRDVDELVYGLEGTLTTTIDGKKHEVRPGDALFIPRGSVHHHANLQPTTTRALNVLTPGSIGRGYFEEIAKEVNVPGKPDLAKVKEIMLRHGLVPA